MFADAGITWKPTKENYYKMTWAEFTDACAKLKAKGYTPIGWGNEGGYMASWWWRPLMMESLASRDDFLKLFTNEMKWNDPRLVKNVSLLKWLYDSKYIIEGGNTFAWDEGEHLLVNKRCAMAVVAYHPVDRETIEGLGVDNVGVMLFPVAEGASDYFRKGVMIYEGNSAVVPLWTKVPKLAVEFGRAMLSEENQNMLAEYTGQIPTRRKWDTSKLKYPQEKQILEWLNTMEPLPDIAHYSMPQELFYEGFANGIPMVEGTISVQEFANRLQKRVEQLKYDWLVFNKK
jgi:ABC-type glycerol-3-phosphate transport system substrate-binding protein